MVVYNHGQYLKDSIESVISQEFKNWELIIVDDGSRDNSLEIAKIYAQEHSDRIKVFTHLPGKNLGIAASYILGIGVCRGGFVGFLEGDDIWSERNAQNKIDKLSIEGVGLVYSDVKPFGETETIAMRRLTSRPVVNLPTYMPFNAFPRILVDNFIPSFSATIVRREMLQGIEFISDPKCSMWMDWFIWIQVSMNTKFFFIPERLVFWRIYRESYCSRFISKSGFIKMVLLDLRYRGLLIEKLVLTADVDYRAKFKRLYLLSIAFFKKIFYTFIVWKPAIYVRMH